MDGFPERAAVIRQGDLKRMLTVQINACAIQANGGVRELGIKTGLADGRCPSVGEDAGRVISLAAVIDQIELDGEAIRDPCVAKPATDRAKRRRTTWIVLDGKR